MKKTFGVVFFVVLSLTQLFSEEKQIAYDYPELGLSIGTPGGYNLMVGYSMDNITFRALGMYLVRNYGFLAELNYNLGKSNFNKNGPGLVVGYIDNCDYSGLITTTVMYGTGPRGLVLGVHYFWNLGIFYCSLGGAATLINPSTNPPMVLLFNIGANYRFLKESDSK